MLQLKRLIQADMMKLKSTQLIWMHLYIPLIGLIVFLGYYSFAPWSSFSKISAYFQVLCMVFPILIAVITSMAAEQEYSAGGFQNLLIRSKTKYFTFISKLILFLLLGTFSTIVAVIGFYIGFSFIEEQIFSIFINLAVVGILIGSNLFLYIFHFFLSFRFSKGISIGVGIVEALVCALFITGMGDGRWPFVPSSWSIRFIQSLLIKHHNSGSLFVDPVLHLGVILAIIVTIVSFIMMVIWYTRWEGNKLEE